MMKSSKIDIIKKILRDEERVIFAYLYGSSVKEDAYNDIDIAVFAKPDTDFFLLSADLKIALGEKTGLPPDVFDIRVINGVVEKGDLFALLYLKSVLDENKILVDRDFECRSDFLEAYSSKYRECEGLFNEVLV